jgi:YD repeat-containing protein
LFEDYTDGVPTNNSNKTTEYTYGAAGNILTLTAVQPTGTPSQTTGYVYGVSTVTGSAIDSNDILAATQYPDPTTGLPSSSQEETYTVNALGEIITKTDRNSTVHTYTYDVLGRQIADAVTTLGEGVDDAVLRIETAYDTQGNAYLITSFDAASEGNIVNQVLRTFNGLRQLTAEYQEHSGEVDTETTPMVQYTYSEMEDEANHSRLTSIIYPNGRVLNFNYDSGLDDSISRLS